MKKVFLLIVVLASFAFVGNALALTMDVGTKLLLIDGNDDDNVTVGLSSYDIADGYYLQYSVNGGGWQDVAGPAAGWDADTFYGGDVLDFALVGTGSLGTYVLSEDFNDDGFSIVMSFGFELDPSFSQQPIMTSPYYAGVNIAWTIEDPAGFTRSSHFVVGGGDEGFYDGVAPVPEPGTLLLLGSGLIGLAYLKRRKS